MTTKPIEGIDPGESLRLRGLWEVAERSGLHRASSNLEAALIAYTEALDAKRVVKAHLDDAQADHDSVAALTETVVSRNVAREGNKTFVPDTDTDGGRRQVVADEAKAWVARQVAADPEVKQAAAALAAARTQLEEASDRIAVAERRVSLAKYQSDAAVALTNLLATAFTERTH